MAEMIFKGQRVIELASVLAGPAVGMFFAELGAEVIKVENFRQGGDVTRSWKLASESNEDGSPAYFSAVNWGKRSVGIDLRREEGRAIVYRLVAGADIVISSFKPGDAAKLGMEAATLRAKNPRLIVGEITAYGPHDPRVGYDAIIQAEAGFTALNGTPESGPVKMPVALMDLLAAHQLKEALLVAMWQRERTGEGAHVQVSLLQSGVASLANQALNWLKGGVIPRRMGSGHPNIVPYGDIFPTSDGRGIVLAVGSDKQFFALCDILGKAEWAKEFPSNAERVKNRELLNQNISERTREWDLVELLARLEKAGVPAGAVNDMPAVFEQEAAKEMLLSSGGIKGLRTIAFHSSGWALAAALPPPPVMGTGTDEVLRTAAGYDDNELNELRNSGLIS